MAFKSLAARLESIVVLIFYSRKIYQVLLLGQFLYLHSCHKFQWEAIRWGEKLQIANSVKPKSTQTQFTRTLSVQWLRTWDFGDRQTWTSSLNVWTLAKHVIYLSLTFLICKLGYYTHRIAILIKLARVGVVYIYSLISQKQHTLSWEILLLCGWN